MSLRARLIGVLLAVAAAGLVALAAITYAEQRSFLLDRADRQAQSALPIVESQLAREGHGLPDPRRRGGFGPAGRRGGRGGPPGGVSLPPGTFGQRRDAMGRPAGSVVLSLPGQAEPSRPALPDRLEPGHPRTVEAVDGSVRYRVAAYADPGGTGATVVAVPLREADQTLDRLLVVLGLVILGVLGVLAVVSHAVVGVGLRPLDRMGETAGAIAAGDLSRRVAPATPRTEVGRLGLALNAMLDRLEEAFAQRAASEDRLRRFLADASHELRTPLSSIRGYAELHRMGAARSNEDVAKAMRRIEGEAARMGVLVEDLLALARLDEVRATTREPVDVAALAADAVHDARASAPDRTVALDAPAGATVPGDPAQLRQVLGNLLRNALVHTPAGTAVEVTVRHAGDHVRVAVRDHGPGLPVADSSALFERFWRAGAGRERGPAGAGLGLAIVAGIVAAHGGRVTARDAPGGGAEFVVALPARAPAPERGPATVRQPA